MPGERLLAFDGYVEIENTKGVGGLAVAVASDEAHTRISDKEMGMSIRWVRQYQIGTDQNDSRFAILIGPAVLQARCAVVVEG